nr:MAG: RNA dependent RNA polymerase [Karstula totivirus]
MLDTNVLQVPCPRGANPLWDMMKVAKPKDTPNLLTMDDGRSLSGMDSRLQMKTCLIIGGLLSIGASIVLHSINITGRELRLWAKDDPSRSTDLLRQLFQATEGGTVAPYYQMIIGSLQQLTEATIHTDALPAMKRFPEMGLAWSTEMPTLRGGKVPGQVPSPTLSSRPHSLGCTEDGVIIGGTLDLKSQSTFPLIWSWEVRMALSISVSIAMNRRISRQPQPMTVFCTFLTECWH